ncbi:DUF5333 family protein [Jannaschia donghaensis]|uniref:DUF5333 family protein n=1 Tax=Jannaschia donghaensis TaxID=420998 RepID=UPI0011873467|nr:DUF5333 family protein [Jannaschia donghaensis]
MSFTLKTAALTAFTALALAACQTASVPAATPAVALNTDTVALQANTQSFAQDTAVAAFYAQRCADRGITLAGGSPDAASEAFFARMTAAGYSRPQIEAATASVDTGATGQAAISYLEGRGLQDGDDRLCASARTEVSQGTAVGQLLSI